MPATDTVIGEFVHRRHVPGACTVTLYRDAVAPALQRVVECSTRRRRILNLVQEALSQLRLDMKYLIFDLEATRRERDEYRELLEKDGRL